MVWRVKVELTVFSIWFLNSGSSVHGYINTMAIHYSDLDHLTRPQSASERDKSRGEHPGSKTKMHVLFQPKPRHLAWGDKV